MDRLTVEDCECIENACETSTEVRLAKQLADTMRENERLRKALQLIADDGLSAQWVGKVAKEALSNKDSDVEPHYPNARERQEIEDRVQGRSTQNRGDNE